MGLFKNLLSGIQDLSELQVQTFTGELTTELHADDAKKVLNWQALVTNAKTDTAGTIKLVAATSVKIDGDIDQFIAASASDEMRQSHAAAVEAGRKVREGLVSMFKDLVDAD